MSWNLEGDSTLGGSWIPGDAPVSSGGWGASSGGAATGSWGVNDSVDWQNNRNADNFGKGGDDISHTDNKCRNCGGEGHYARECTEPRRRCSGINSATLERPPNVCKNCKTEGHRTMDCKEHRKFDLSHIVDKTPEEAWALMKKASAERDLEDFRESLKVYSKAVPDATFADIERKMRDEFFKIYLIALEREASDCISFINLQGKLDCTYVVGFFYSFKPQRGNLKDRWPASVEDNLERLEDAGLPYNRQIPKCSNCCEMGHTARGCKEDRSVIERVEIKCVNCNEPGHRARDCPQPRVDRFACRICGAPDHKASDCPTPRSAEDVECKRCGEMGHFAKDCDKPRGVSTFTYGNRNQAGHYTRDFPEEKDCSTIMCYKCGKMGHTIKRCPTAPGNGGNVTFYGANDFLDGGGFGLSISNDDGRDSRNFNTQTDEDSGDSGDWLTIDIA